MGGAVTVAPIGGVSLFEAIEKQLGLKLLVEKHSMPIAVIDHMDRTVYAGRHYETARQ